MTVPHLSVKVNLYKGIISIKDKTEHNIELDITAEEEIIQKNASTHICLLGLMNCSY